MKKKLKTNPVRMMQKPFVKSAVLVFKVGSLTVLRVEKCQRFLSQHARKVSTGRSQGDAPSTLGLWRTIVVPTLECCLRCCPRLSGESFCASGTARSRTGST
jgi:hypothetical protein